MAFNGEGFEALPLWQKDGQESDTITTEMETAVYMEQEEAPMNEMGENLEAAPMELANDIEEKAGVIKVSNISPQANVEQMTKLFGFLGNVLELALYPKE